MINKCAFNAQKCSKNRFQKPQIVEYYDNIVMLVTKLDKVIKFLKETELFEDIQENQQMKEIELGQWRGSIILQSIVTLILGKKNKKTEFEKKINEFNSL